MKSENRILNKQMHSKALHLYNILIAEDNEVNQLLARSILQHWGMRSKIAISGDEVIEMVRTEDFDLILMDIQMPFKSGIEAAREIRELQNEKKRNVPIIAVTANALKGEEKKYIEVGINDYITKPFREGDLWDIMERVLFQSDSSNIPASVETSKNSEMITNEKLYDFDQLNEIADGNMEFIKSLAQLFIVTMPADSSELLDAARAQDWSRVSKTAHKMKSTIDSMNIKSISQEIRILELDAKNKTNTPALLPIAENVDGVIKRVVGQLQTDLDL